MNKVLINLYVPMLDNTFDIFIPVNEYVWKINKLIVKSLSDLTFNTLDVDEEYIIINPKTGKIYDNNEIILETDIRNLTKLLLINNKKI